MTIPAGSLASTVEATLPPPSPQLLKEGQDTLHELQLILATMGKDNRRKSPEFMTLMAQYKQLGTKLHEARKRIPPPPPAPKSTPVAPYSGALLGKATVASRAHELHVASGSTQAAPAPAALPNPVDAPAAAQTAMSPVPAPASQETAQQEPPANPVLPLALPKFAGTLGPPGTKCVDFGPPVANLQRLLVALGYKVEATGAYDVRTFRSVQELQKAHKLPVTGITGLETRKLLNGMVTG